MKNNNKFCSSSNEDITVINRILAGDERLFNFLVKKYQNRIKGIISRVVKNYCDVEELTTDTFLQAFQQLSKYSDNHRFFSWLAVIARNKSVDYYRQRKRRGHYLFDDFDLVSYKLTTEEDTELNNFYETVDSAINRLDYKSAEMIRLHYFDHTPVIKIAELFNMSEGSVRSCMFRTRKKLSRDKLLLQYAS
jgi:RNA polymerase sigma-70 factor (ECF subfamily)